MQSKVKECLLLGSFFSFSVTAEIQISNKKKTNKNERGRSLGDTCGHHQRVVLQQ